jgi:hypothetical protein
MSPTPTHLIAREHINDLLREAECRRRVAEAAAPGRSEALDPAPVCPPRRPVRNRVIGGRQLVPIWRPVADAAGCHRAELDGSMATDGLADARLRRPSQEPSLCPAINRPGVDLMKAAAGRVGGLVPAFEEIRSSPSARSSGYRSPA